MLAPAFCVAILDLGLRRAKLPLSAGIEDLDARTPRGIERGRLTQLADLSWIDQHFNLLITGPTSVGKSYLACALAHHAYRNDLSVRYLRLPRLSEELLRAGDQQRKSAFFSTPSVVPRGAAR